MASWALDHTFTLSLDQIPTYIASDGTNLYFIVEFEDAWRYNLSTNAETQIIDGSALANLYSLGGGIYELDGDVYLAAGYIGDDFLADGYVHKWTGVLNGLTNVYTIMEDDDAGTYPGIHPGTLRLYYDDVSNVLVAVGVSYFDFSGGYPYDTAAQASAYSADGSSWLAAIFSGASPGINVGVGVFPSEAGEFPQGVYDQFLESSLDAFTNVLSIFKFNGTGWALVKSDEGEGYHHTDPIQEYHWTANSTGEHTTDLNFTAYDTPDATIGIPFQLNLPYSLGYKIDGADTKIYSFQTGTWVLLDTIAGETLQVRAFVRAADNTVYILANDGANEVVWVRDEMLPVPTDRRLYIYRTEDKGLTWTSKLVET